jgi:hypothetical protein
MTSQSPRIYTYKITFEEVPYYYYGVHKEKYANQKYFGSPQTNKWCWEIYTPKKQILEIFNFTDEGWLDAQSVEKRLIKPVFNTDKWCLNERCGGSISLNVLRKHGRINGIKNGPKSFNLNLGIHALTSEQKSEYAKISGRKNKENMIGVHGRTKEEMLKHGKMGGEISGKKHYKNKTGVCGRSIEKMSEDGKKGGKISTSQIWECTVTGYRTNAGALANYQKSRGIDKSLRLRIS